MCPYTRFAVYYLPPEGSLTQFGASWLGWDCQSGTPAKQPEIEGIEKATEAPRQYGFHATLKPPFRLRDGCQPVDLRSATVDLARRLPPVRLEGLELNRLGNFLALQPVSDSKELNDLAARCVMDLDNFRAPPTPQEQDRRRKVGLSHQQEQLLTLWGYPYVLEEFRFHMTLSGRLDKADLDRFQTEITRHLPPLPVPYIIDSIALVGQRSDGMFTLIERFALSG